MNSSYYVDTTYGVSQTAGILGALAGVMVFIWIIAMLANVLLIVSMWKMFTKAGKPGWAAIIPIYNVYIMCEIAKKEWWYILLLFVPIAQIYAMFVICDGIAKKFRKSTGFTIGMMLVPYVFFPILAFGKNNTLDISSNQSDAMTDVSNEEPVQNTEVNVNTVEPQNFDFDPNTVSMVQPQMESFNVNPSLEQNPFEQSVQPSTFEQQAAPVINDFAMPKVEQTPVMNDFTQPVVQQTPTMKQTPVSNEFTMPKVEQNPVVNQALVMNDFTQPVVQQTPVMNNSFEQVVNEPVMPTVENGTVQPEVNMANNEPNDSLWSNNNNINNGQM